mmetsp:Transcript_15353/g.25598  ORF Transcript_15353/g.25598 Transcript_15353/m.25598 type:complete len:392 (+) Transcript_15353:57-1232(+)
MSSSARMPPPPPPATASMNMADDSPEVVEEESKVAAAASTSSSTNAAAAAAADSRYSFDGPKMAALQKESPWTKEAKYFEKVAISPSAIMKMMMHCQSGVTKGISKGGNPIEVMGMLLGRPDPDTPKTLIVVDAFPLPIEGFETRVVADDQNVINHMIALSDCLEETRHEKFMGWYHSHPFDVGPHSHCFLSQTDLSTQLQWQRAEDPHGNPFVALVVDPLRSLHKAVPEIKAFRAYPPEYNAPVEYECPDGSTEVEEQKRLELWGSCWNRYYTLEVEYFMSSSARRVLEQLTQDYLWMRTLSMEQQESEEQNNATTADALLKASAPLLPPSARTSDFRHATTTLSTTVTSAETKDVSQAVDQVVNLATKQLYATTLTNVKKQVFSKSDNN